MSIEIHALGKVAITKETAANWGVDLTATATYIDVPLEGVATLALEKDVLKPQTQQQYMDAWPQHILGRSRATLTMKIPLHASGNVSGTTPAEADMALLQMLAIVMGGVDDSNADTTVTSAASEDVITWASGTREGGLVAGWSDTAGVHLHEIKSIAGSVLTLHTKLPSTPSGSDALYAGTTLYLTENPPDAIQALVHGSEADDKWLLYGGQLQAAPQIEISPGQIPFITLTVAFADWALEPSSALAAASYSYLPIMSDGEIRVEVAGTNTRTVIDAASENYTLNGPIYVPRPSGLATVNGLKGWRRKPGLPIAEIKYSVPFEDAAWFTSRDARTEYHIERQMGMTRGGIVLLSFPQCRLTNVQRADASELAYQELTFEATIDATTVNSSNTALARSAMRLHLG